MISSLICKCSVRFTQTEPSGRASCCKTQNENGNGQRQGFPGIGGRPADRREMFSAIRKSTLWFFAFSFRQFYPSTALNIDKIGHLDISGDRTGNSRARGGSFRGAPRSALPVAAGGRIFRRQCPSLKGYWCWTKTGKSVQHQGLRVLVLDENRQKRTAPGDMAGKEETAKNLLGHWLSALERNHESRFFGR